MNILLKAVGWALGVFLLLTGLVLMFANFLGGLIIFFVGLCFIPPFLQKLEEKIKYNLTWKFQVGTLVVGFIGLCVVIPLDEEHKIDRTEDALLIKDSASDTKMPVEKSNLISVDKIDTTARFGIKVYAEPKNSEIVQFKVETDIPLPIEVIASVDLKAQKPKDTYIGTSKKVKIVKSPFVFALDISKDELPSGEYDAVVTFYPKWGAEAGNTLPKRLESELKGSYAISLKSMYGSAQDRKGKDTKQLWVMSNVHTGMTWDKKKFVSKLGEYKEIEIKNRNPKIIKVYYFNQAEMTVFVNKLKNKVVTWRKGQVDAF